MPINAITVEFRPSSTHPTITTFDLATSILPPTTPITRK
jgi:hypothetical protein